MRIHRLKWFLIATLLAFVCAPGCALKGNARHIAVVGNVALAESLFAVQATADTLRATNQISQEQRQGISQWLLPALETGRSLSKLTATWPEGQPAPPELQALVTQLRDLVDKGLSSWPDSAGKSAFMTKLSIAQNAALALVIAFAR